MVRLWYVWHNSFGCTWQKLSRNFSSNSWIVQILVHTWVDPGSQVMTLGISFPSLTPAVSPIDLVLRQFQARVSAAWHPRGKKTAFPRRVSATSQSWLSSTRHGPWLSRRPKELPRASPEASELKKGAEGFSEGNPEFCCLKRGHKTTSVCSSRSLHCLGPMFL